MPEYGLKPQIQRGASLSQQSCSFHSLQREVVINYLSHILCNNSIVIQRWLTDEFLVVFVDWQQKINISYSFIRFCSGFERRTDGWMFCFVSPLPSVAWGQKRVKVFWGNVRLDEKVNFAPTNKHETAFFWQLKNCQMRVARNRFL